MRAPGVLFHHVDGVGEPVLLLNGVAMSVAGWQPIAAPLSRRYQVIRCDFRGQLMTPVEPPADVAEHAADVVALLDHLDVEAAHLVGTSYGGVIGTLAAARWPDRVRSLISIASADGFDDVMAVEVARWREACLLSLQGEDRGLLSDAFEGAVYSPTWVESHRAERTERRRQVAALPDEWFQGLAGLLEHAPSISIRDALREVRCPTLIVAAELDRFVPFDRTRSLARRIEGAKFVLVEGAGPAVVVEQPDKVVEICLEFLEGLEVSTSDAT
jgi:pimeloyl-ACP methyl ester carboxylesterase